MGMSFQELGISFALNFGITAAFLLAFSFFSVQPFNARVYFTKWFVVNDEKAIDDWEKGTSAKLQYSWRTYLHALDWMFVALRKPERELLEHAGPDMVVYLRMLKLGFKIFFPVMLVGFAALLPTYYFGKNLQGTDDPTIGNIDYFTLGNIPPGSTLHWVPLVFAWVFNLWALYLMGLEYEAVAQLRLDYLSDQKKSAQQFTVLVRQVPKDRTRTVAQQTAQFFSVLHRDNYLMTTPVYDARTVSKLEGEREWTENKIMELQIRLERKPQWRPRHKTGLCGLKGPAVDSLEFYQARLEELGKLIAEERDRVLKDKDAIMPASFVSFRTRWGAAVAAQTQQSKDNTKWITTWAPEPEDVCWSNLPINYLSLNARKFLVAAIVAVTIIFYTIPVAFVQGLSSLDSLEKTFPWLTSILKSAPFLNAFLTSFLPGLALMVFLAVLPICMRLLSSLEGYVSKSQIERAAAGKMFYFIFFTVFLSNLLIGSLWSNIQKYIQNPAELPAVLGAAISSKSTFFMTYTMINGWSAVAGEVVRITPLVLFQIKNFLLVRTPQERFKAMSPSGPDYVSLMPMIELYFLLPFMFWVISPIYMIFVIVFFVFGFIVYRNQFINVYAAEYDLGGGYWPHFHLRALTCLILSQFFLVFVFLLRGVWETTVCLLPLPLISILYHMTFIAARFEPTFERLALEEAMRKDTIDAVAEPDADPRGFLTRKYLHPALRSAFEEADEEAGAKKEERQEAAGTLGLRASASAQGGSAASGTGAGVGTPLVPVKRHPRSRISPTTSRTTADDDADGPDPRRFEAVIAARGASAAAAAAAAALGEEAPGSDMRRSLLPEEAHQN